MLKEALHGVPKMQIAIITEEIATVKPETLASGNFDEFGESESNRQT